MHITSSHHLLLSALRGNTILEVGVLISSFMCSHSINNPITQLVITTWRPYGDSTHMWHRSRWELTLLMHGWLLQMLLLLLLLDRARIHMHWLTLSNIMLLVNILITHINTLVMVSSINTLVMNQIRLTFSINIWKPMINVAWWLAVAKASSVTEVSSASVLVRLLRWILLGKVR